MIPQPPASSWPPFKRGRDPGCLLHQSFSSESQNKKKTPSSSGQPVVSSFFRKTLASWQRLPIHWKGLFAAQAFITAFAFGLRIHLIEEQRKEQAQEEAWRQASMSSLRERGRQQQQQNDDDKEEMRPPRRLKPLTTTPRSSSQETSEIAAPDKSEMPRGSLWQKIKHIWRL